MSAICGLCRASSPTFPPAPTLQHVTQPLRPAQLDACLAFYRLLGFREVQPPPGIAGRARWLQHGATQMHLMWQDEPRPGSGHVGVVVAAYAEAVAALTAAGHRVEPRTPHWGAERAYVRDPAGNLVEIMAAPPPGDAPARMGA